ncbi:MAG: F0F1 ATP synthase subunit epsilon [Bacteroidia bacterium]|nr:F0F1 ATP synthase subunit epsilon [Bacteroidia bacterium]
MKVGIYTPSGPLYEGEAQRVSAFGVEGSFEILEGHAPLIAQLAAGPLSVLTAEGEKTFFLHSGFLWVEVNGEVRVLAS